MTKAAETLAKFACTLRYEDIPAEVIERARICITDAIGVAAFGARFPWSQMVLEQAKATGSGGPCRLPGVDGVRLHVPQAALALGTFSHAFEMDSLRNPSAGIHPGATIALPGLAQAEAIGASGRALLTAIVAGTEVMSRIGLATHHTPEERGFHAPGITGPFGAASAAASLLKFSPEKTLNAFGIAGSMGSGLLAFAKAGTGGMVKRLHMGRAAEGGILAASLAARGFEGPPTVIDGRFGVLEAFCNESDVHELTKNLGSQWEMMRLCIKPYALHVTAQGSVELLRTWIAEHGIKGDDIREIVVHTSQKVVSHHSNTAPTDVMGAQYSTPFTLAIAAYYDPADPTIFNDMTVNDPRVRDLAGRIKTVKREQAGGTMGVALKATLASGRSLEGSLDAFRGTPERPFGPAEVAAKFDKITAAMDRARRDRLRDALLGIDNLADVRKLDLAG